MADILDWFEDHDLAFYIVRGVCTAITIALASLSVLVFIAAIVAGDNSGFWWCLISVASCGVFAGITRYLNDM